LVNNLQFFQDNEDRYFEKVSTYQLKYCYLAGGTIIPYEYSFLTCIDSELDTSQIDSNSFREIKIENNTFLATGELLIYLGKISDLYYLFFETEKDVEIYRLSKNLQQEKESKIQLMSDFENYRKRIEAEKVTFGAIANMGLIESIAEVFDDIGLALNDESLNLESARKSLENTRDKLKNSLNLTGVECLNVSVGDNFNSEYMEAVSTIPSEENKGKVIAVISSGLKYKNKDGIIKPAKVVVGK